MSARNHKKTAGEKKRKTLRDIYARVRKEFTAADLQKYAVAEKGIPAEQVLAEMKKIHREVTNARTARRRKNGGSRG